MAMIPQRIDDYCATLLFWLLATVALLAPWMFGAWEPWWFWPFMTAICTATACYATRLLCSGRLGTRRLNFSTLLHGMIVAYVPFLAYALIRAVQANVPMDAERSFLLQLTPVLIAVMTATGLSDSRQRLLATLVLVNMALLGVYGILNHILTGSARVLWLPGIAGYQVAYHRATGSYWCPDHFSGLMEIALALALALLLVRAASTRQRILAGGLALVALWGILLSRSRGGGLVAVVLLLAALFLCTLSWPARTRRRLRVIGVCLILSTMAAFALGGGHYVTRFKSYPWTHVQQWDRYQMSAAALRAWHSAPWIGVGPGMHQNLWPHFAPSPDGDRATGRWPSTPNTHFHSFEAHNDWVQLLEEYGAIGLGLFLLGIFAAATGLYRRWRRWACVLSAGTAPPSGMAWLVPGALLAALAMGTHSFGDFNLQMPATTWVLGTLAGLAIASARQTPPLPRRHRSGPAGPGSRDSRNRGVMIDSPES